jgi:glycosyltransferase involved in cell wall biosynthesis
MSNRKILWLCSWYPSKVDLFNGDFIQRHAKAASLFNDIYVIHVTGVPGSELVSKTEEEINSSGKLTEKIIYFKTSGTNIGKIISNYRLISLYKKAIKTYINENGIPDLLHVHVPMKAGIAGLWAKRYKLPMLVSEHWGIYNKIVRDNYNSRSIFFKTLTKRIIGAADIFISVSNYLIRVIRQITRVGESKVIPNAVNTSYFKYKENRNGVFRFIHVSNMVPLKNAEGILRVFRAMSKEKPAELVMVGNIDDKQEKYAAELGLTGVNFLGEISYDQVAREMLEADCLLLFSHIENSPCVIGEALCCGLPVIASSVGGIPELVDDSNGILIEPGNENALKDAMLKMMNEYETFDRSRISGNAVKKFSYESTGKQFDELYSSVIKIKS